MTPVGGMECPCGRTHTPHGLRRRRVTRPEAEDALTSEIYEAGSFGERNRHSLDYASNCEQPIVLKTNSATGRLFAERRVRCRKCSNCLRARKAYWALAAVEQTQRAEDAGFRTWFGTLTFKPEWQQELLLRAREKHPHPNADWWEEPICDERFRFVRDEALAEVQRYWKRLRKAGHRFKYFLVFERHKSGLPHLHWLLHEQQSRILKRELQQQWPFGFTQVKLVSGRKPGRGPRTAAWYVAKYLSKSHQSRQIASRLYRPSKRHGPLGDRCP